MFVRASAMSSSNAVFDSTLVKNVAVFNESAETTTTGLRNIDSDIQGGKGVLNVRRLNEIGTYSGGVFTPDALASLTAPNTVVKLIISGTTGAGAAGADEGNNTPTALTAYSLTFPVKDRRAGVDDGASVTLPARRLILSINEVHTGE